MREKTTDARRRNHYEEEYYKHETTDRLRCDYMGYIRGQYMRVLGGQVNELYSYASVPTQRPTPYVLRLVQYGIVWLII